MSAGAVCDDEDSPFAGDDLEGVSRVTDFSSAPVEMLDNLMLTFTSDIDVCLLNFIVCRASIDGRSTCHCSTHSPGLDSIASQCELSSIEESIHSSGLPATIASGPILNPPMNALIPRLSWSHMVSSRTRFVSSSSNETTEYTSVSFHSGSRLFDTTLVFFLEAISLLGRRYALTKELVSPLGSIAGRPSAFLIRTERSTKVVLTFLCREVVLFVDWWKLYLRASSSLPFEPSMSTSSMSLSS